ncbi:glycophorin-C isoform X2 [Eretmochelys imbricata]
MNDQKNGTPSPCFTTGFFLDEAETLAENHTGDLGGSSAPVDVAVIGGVIAAVAIVLICLLIVMLRYTYRHKGTYHTNEAKGTEFAESADAALRNDPALQEAVDESKKEYFI